MNKRAVGAGYEKQAADYLQARGAALLEQNFRNRFGEIDLIVRHQSAICFVEVKYRAGDACGAPAEAVTLRKQRKITKVAKYYLLTHGYGEWTDCRFDVVSICGDKIEWLQNAFEAVGE